MTGSRAARSPDSDSVDGDDSDDPQLISIIQNVTLKALWLQHSSLCVDGVTPLTISTSLK